MPANNKLKTSHSIRVKQGLAKMKTKSGKKRKVWVGYVVTYDRKELEKDIKSVMSPSKDYTGDKKLRITIEELSK